jgi:hypothetical protein
MDPTEPEPDAAQRAGTALPASDFFSTSGKLYHFVAIDRISKFAYAELHEKARQ